MNSLVENFEQAEMVKAFSIRRVRQRLFIGRDCPCAEARLEKRLTKGSERFSRQNKSWLLTSWPLGSIVSTLVQAVALISDTGLFAPINLLF